MNTTTSIPGLKELYFRDLTIQRAARTMGFFLFAAAGIKWATQPVEAVVKVENSPFEIWAAQWGPSVAVGIAAVAAVILIRRYLWVRKVLSDGIIIRATVEDIDTYTRENSHSDTTPAFDRSYTRTYVATIRYAWHGLEKKRRFRLPNSPSTYQIAKGGPVDLIALESDTDSPLIRIVYQGRF